MKGRGVWNHNWWGDRPNDSEETKSVNIHRDWSKNIQAQFEQLRHTFRFVSCAVKKTLVKLEHPIRYIQVGGYLNIKEEEKRERTWCLGLGIDDQHRFWMKTFEQISANSLECRKKIWGLVFSFSWSAFYALVDERIPQKLTTFNQQKTSYAYQVSIRNRTHSTMQSFSL